jgi:hypothetical protein
MRHDRRAAPRLAIVVPYRIISINQFYKEFSRR